jgi:hypothetical protein
MGNKYEGHGMFASCQKADERIAKLLERQLAEARKLLREWRSAAYLPSAHEDLCKRTDTFNPHPLVQLRSWHSYMKEYGSEEYAAQNIRFESDPRAGRRQGMMTVVPGTKVSNEQLDSLINWCWSNSVAVWKHPESPEDAQVINPSWLEKWYALTELRDMRKKKRIKP